MKRRIHIELLVTSGLAILLTLTFAMFVFYGLFRSQIIRDLETDARVMKNMGVFDDISRMAEKNGSISSEDLRITVVSPGGDVLFDSSADAAAMENHEDRPEIRTALEAGEGSGSRRSETMDKNLFYYAVRMENGNVLRISREADSFFAVFQNMLPTVLEVSLVLFVLSIFLSNYFTNGKRQSNRGECIQACRFKYSVMEESRPGQYFPVEEDEHGTYIFNSKDLCMIDHIPELIEAGVSSLKIEGRMKSVYYVAAVVAAYRKAIDSYYESGAAYSVHPEWREELEKVSHRPYTTAFAFQDPDHSAQEYVKSQPEQPYDFIGLVLEQHKENDTVKVQQRNYFKAGEVVECLTPAGDVFSVTIGRLTNKDGEEVAAAPHPLEELTMITGQDLPPYTILRRRARG